MAEIQYDDLHAEALWPLPMLPAQVIPYDEMRRILGLPDVRPAALHRVHERFKRGDRIICETVNGSRYGGVIIDAVEHGDEVTYTLADPRWSEQAQAFSTGREPARANGAAKDPTVAVEGYRVFIEAIARLTRVAGALHSVPVVLFPPKPQCPRGPRVPRPSHTPPMWAPDPARTRRTKNGGIDMRTPRV